MILAWPSGKGCIGLGSDGLADEFDHLLGCRADPLREHFVGRERLELEQVIGARVGAQHPHALELEDLLMITIPSRRLR